MRYALKMVGGSESRFILSSHIHPKPALHKMRVSVHNVSLIINKIMFLIL